MTGYRADLEAARAAALAENNTAAVSELDRAIGDADGTYHFNRLAPEMTRDPLNLLVRGSFVWSG